MPTNSLAALGPKAAAARVCQSVVVVLEDTNKMLQKEADLRPFQLGQLHAFLERGGRASEGGYCLKKHLRPH